MPAVLSMLGISPLGILKWLAIAAAVVGLLLGVRQSGKTAARMERLQADVKGAQTRAKIEQATAGLSDDELDRSLRDPARR